MIFTLNIRGIPEDVYLQKWFVQCGGLKIAKLVNYNNLGLWVLYLYLDGVINTLITRGPRL